MNMKKTLALFLAGLTVAASALFASCSSSSTPEDQATAGAALEKKSVSDMTASPYARMTSFASRNDTGMIYIGNDVTVTDRCHISCIDRVTVGDGVLLGRDVYISDNSHGDTTGEMADIPPKKRPLTTKGPVKIGNNVWIGRQVTVLSGVTIGDGAVIGANSVVNRDIPANCVAAGNPAQMIRKMKG